MHYPKTGSCNKDLQRTRNRNKKNRKKNSAHTGNDTTSDTVTEPDAGLQGYRLPIKYWQTISKAKEWRGIVQETLLVGPHVPGTESAALGRNPEESLRATGAQQEEQDSYLFLQVPAHA